MTAKYRYEYAWMDHHWGHIKSKIITEWQAMKYVAAVATYYNATQQERKKLREELVGDR